MRLLSTLRRSLERDVSPDADGTAATRRINRRRFRVFMTVFLLVLIPGLLWNFLRPAEYRATARVQIAPGSTEPRASPSTVTAPELSRSPSELLTQVQILTSRPLLEKAGVALAKAGLPLAGSDPAARLRDMIRAEAVAGTDVVELTATGAWPEQLAAALNTLVGLYGEEMKASYGTAAGEGMTDARQEMERLSVMAQERRQRLDAFRSQSGVLSPEREENEAVARIKGLTSSLNTATEKVAVAEARLRAVKASIAAGRSGLQAKDDPTLSAMSTRASQIREEIRNMERVYTPEFMRMDPQARALQSRLAEMERQIEVQRAAGQDAVLMASQEDVESARSTVERLQSEINAQRGAMQSFSQRFTQAKSLEDDLAQIEKASREAQERLAKLAASERSRLPVMNLVEAASVPRSALGPNYLRDALLVLGTAFVLGFSAIWFVEIFNRQPPPAQAQATTLIVPQPWGGMSAGSPGALASERTGMLPADANAAPALLGAAPPVLRELAHEEVGALLAASSGDVRWVLGALLMGLTADEAAGLCQGDFDADAGVLTVRGNASRLVTMPPWMQACRPASAGGPEAPLLQDAGGAALTPGDIQSMLSCAAFDANLSAAAGVSPEVLRHTCIAWLVRQGLRFSELGALVGRPGAGALARYAEIAPPGPKRSAAEIDLLMPALREAPVAGHG